MEISRIKDENCLSINEITQEPPLKIKCLKGNCTLWCEKFARCLHQSDKWQKKCARKFQKLFRGHRRTKIKVHAKENQSSLQIRVKFCEWKSRYKVYTIESLDNVSEENGMYQVHFVLNMRSFLINNFINLIIHKSIWLFDLSIVPSLFQSQSVVYQSRVFLTHQFTHSFVYYFFLIVLPRLFKLINHFSGLWWVLLLCPFYVGDLQEEGNLRKEVLYLYFWKDMYIAFNFLGKKLVFTSWYAFIDYVTFNRETSLRRTVCIPTLDM